MTDEISPEDQELGEFFKGEEEVEVETEVVKDKAAETEADTKGVTEEAEVEKPAEVETETEPPSDKESKLVPIAALHDERRKAQQFKERAEKAEKLIPEKDEAPDPYEDIDAYTEYVRTQVQKELQAEQRKANSDRIDLAREQMLEKHDDFIEMENIFTIMQASDPTLMGKMLASGNEVEFAYKTAKEYKAALLGDVKPPVIPDLTETEKRKAQALGAPNLATATAQATNAEQKLKESDINDVFADQTY